MKFYHDRAVQERREAVDEQRRKKLAEHKHYGSGSRAKYFKERVAMNMNDAKQLRMK